MRVNGKVNDIKVTDWQSFKLRFSEQIKHIVGFEEMFIDNILANIPEISALDVIPQYHFKDETGNRYIDFMIINKDKGWCLPIELDGYSKMVGNGNEYNIFNDFLTRQNAIIKQFGLVLRYTNKTMINNPKNIINEIRDTLHKQANKQSIDEVEKRHRQALISDYHKEIEELRAFKKQTINQNQDIKAISNQINDIQQQLNNRNAEIDTEEERSFNWFWIIIILILAGISLYFIIPSIKLHKQNQTRQVEKETNSPQDTLYDDSPKFISNNKQDVIVRNPQPTSQSTTKTKETNRLCGNVSEVKGFAKGTYLNLDGLYPNHKASITLWNIKREDTYYLINEYICVNGNIEMYKGKPKINAYSLKAFYKE